MIGATPSAEGLGNDHHIFIRDGFGWWSGSFGAFDGQARCMVSGEILDPRVHFYGSFGRPAPTGDRRVMVMFRAGGMRQAMEFAGTVDDSTLERVALLVNSDIHVQNEIDLAPPVTQEETE